MINTCSCCFEISPGSFEYTYWFEESFFGWIRQVLFNASYYKRDELFLSFSSNSKATDGKAPHQVKKPTFL